IVGADQQTTTIDGSGQADRVLQLSGFGVQAQLSNLTITGGTAPTPANTSGVDPGWGGGISVYSTSGSLILDSVTVSDNTASNGGGGIDSFGRLWLTNSTVGGNQVTNSNDAWSGGGGIDNEVTGSANLAGTSVSYNTITGTGSPAVTQVTGGGVVTFGTLAVSGSFLDQNIVNIPSGASPSSTSEGDGGGIAVDGPTTLTGATVSGNSVVPAAASTNTTAFGGGIDAIAGLSTVAGSGITGNTATSDSVTAGGGIAVQSGLPGITGTQITGNAATVTNGSFTGGYMGLGSLAGGGGVAAVQDGSVAMASSTISDNSVQASTTESAPTGATLEAGGGGLLVLSGTSVINSTTISGNGAGSTGATITEGDGGGVLALNSSVGGLIIQRSQLTFNTAYSGLGGGLVSVDTGSTTLQSDTITGNTATAAPGAFANASGSGGGVFGSGTTSITNTTLAGNHADLVGGGLAEAGGGLLTSDTVSGNTAGSVNIVCSGAGLYAAPLVAVSQPVQILNSTFAGNDAQGPGGGIVANSVGVDLNYSTVTANGGTSGSGIYVAPGSTSSPDSSVNVTGSIVSGNVTDDCASAYYGSVVTSSGYNLLGSTCTNDPAPTDLVGVDAKLGPLADNGGPTQTVALLPGSPAINAGGGPNCPSTDQRGEPRPQGKACDIGAFESAYNGYWLVASDGGIFTFGDAQFFGSEGGQPLNKPVEGMASTPDGQGYWLVASDGGIFTFGDAQFFGSEGGHKLTKPVVGMAATPDGGGYWLTAANGSVFAFGDAGTFGDSSGQALNAPIEAIAGTASGHGYTQVASDGGIFTFGDAGFFGSIGGQPLNAPITGIATTNDGEGYWLFATDGGVFSFGDAQFSGSMGGQHLNKPVVGGATPG
ncbi:MAG TPA: choice-of-anchor Q domain-containing protein, partial [Acidimicrobiales bacterium]|nr:choice-of-anchor Q domain-containing protein [Acidimicrobiales bacterium]